MFTTPGTFTWTAPANIIWVTAVGGGGAGGSMSMYGSGGGGSGGVVLKQKVTVIQGQAYPLTVGAGGLAVAGTKGNDGGSTNFASLVVAPGGKGGFGVSSGKPWGYGGAAGNNLGQNGSNGYYDYTYDTEYFGKGGSNLYGIGGYISRSIQAYGLKAYPTGFGAGGSGGPSLNYHPEYDFQAMCGTGGFLLAEW